MSAPRLNAYQRAMIDGEVDDLFDLLLTRLLGGSFTGKNLFIGYLRDFTLPGLYEAAVNEEGGRVDTEMVEGIASVAKDFLDKSRSQAKAVTKRKIQSLLHDIDQGRLKPENFATAIDGELADLFGKVKSEVQTIVASETMHVTTMGLKEGIDQINDSLDIEDPVICWVHPLDKDTCEECYRLYYLSDHKTPRVWKESEVSADYHKRGEDVPSWHLAHPNCRGALSTVLPGFGFNGNGQVTWIRDDHREYDYQRGDRPTSGLGARRDRLD
jgi:hypothetical protein